MPCCAQQLAVRMPGLTRNGKHPFKFIGKASTWHHSSKKAPLGALLLPCRQCIGCRLDRSSQWATRLMHETAFHKNACFLTLTYSDDMLPKNRSLIPDHLTTFFKDLRARLEYYGKEKIKYFAVGEYGDQTRRPHYHAALYGPFGCDGPDDLRLAEEPARSGASQFSHHHIAACWPHGLHRYSELSFESAAYVARYCLKKINGPAAQAHYLDRHPEFQRPSKGLGKAHITRWFEDVYPADRVVLPGRGSFTPPPYYDRILEKIDPALHALVKVEREEARKKMTDSSWYEHVNERHREGSVRTLVTEQTLIRSL